MFPHWFAGVAFAAVAIGALVPAAIMSIAAANLFTRNIYVEYIKRDAAPAQQATVSKIASLVVKVGAVLVILLINPQFSIDLQLIGGVIILQTLPAVGVGLYTRWFHRWGLVAGWVAGMGLGMWMLYQIPNPATTTSTSAAPRSRCRNGSTRPHRPERQDDGLRRVRGRGREPARGAVLVTLLCKALRAAGRRRRHRARRLLHDPDAAPAAPQAPPPRRPHRTSCRTRSRHHNAGLRWCDASMPAHSHHRW